METRDQVRQATHGVCQGCVGGTRLDGGLYSRTHCLSSRARSPALLMLLKEADTPRQTHLEEEGEHGQVQLLRRVLGLDLEVII